MPIYEYICKDCGHEFERLARMNDRDDDKLCPECGKKSVTRKFSVFSAQQANEAPAAMPGPCGQCDQMGQCMGGGF